MMLTFETLNFKNVKHWETGEQLQKKYKIHKRTLNFNLDLANMESVLTEYLLRQWLH